MRALFTRQWKPVQVRVNAKGQVQIKFRRNPEADPMLHVAFSANDEAAMGLAHRQLLSIRQSKVEARLNELDAEARKFPRVEWSEGRPTFHYAKEALAELGRWQRAHYVESGSEHQTWKAIHQHGSSGRLLIPWTRREQQDWQKQAGVVAGPGAAQRPWKIKRRNLSRRRRQVRRSYS